VILRDTNYGHLWVLRIGLLLVLTAVVNRRALWHDSAASLWRLGIALVALALVPYALANHAAAQPVGQAAAIVADWLHLLASSVWIGGLIMLVSVLVLATRGAGAEDRHVVYAAAIPRFSTLAISSVILLTLTEFYAAWLEVGNLHALRETAYGL
jgi:copper transport protein